MKSHIRTGLAGLAAGLIIGIGGTAGVVQLAKAPAARLVAQVELLPLPASRQFGDATGTAVMRATARQQLMVVTLHAPQAPGFYEVWLLARDGVSMISLGELAWSPARRRAPHPPRPRRCKPARRTLLRF